MIVCSFWQLPLHLMTGHMSVLLLCEAYCITLTPRPRAKTKGRGPGLRARAEGQGLGAHAVVALQEDLEEA